MVEKKVKKIRVEYKETRVIEKEVYVEEGKEDEYKEKGEEQIISIKREELKREEEYIENYSKKLKVEEEEGIYSIGVGELKNVYIGNVLIGEGLNKRISLYIYEEDGGDKVYLVSKGGSKKGRKKGSVLKVATRLKEDKYECYSEEEYKGLYGERIMLYLSRSSYTFIEVRDEVEDIGMLEKRGIEVYIADKRYIDKK